MELFAVSGLVNAMTAASFGILVFSKNWRARQNQIFLLMTGALALWGFSYWRWLSATDADTALFWIRFLAIGSVFIPVFFLDWVTTLLRCGKKSRDFVALAYFASVAVSAFALTRYFIASVEPKLWFPFWPNAGILYTAYFWILYTGVVLWSVHALYHGWRNEENPSRRGQILYVFWGAVLGFGGGFTNFFLWFDIPIPPYGNFLVAAFPFLLGYSVLKYKLFNVRTITAELIAFALWVFMLIITFVAESTALRLVYGFFTILMTIGGVMLIKAVYKTENLAEELAIANKGQENLIHLISHEVKGGLGKANDVFAEIVEGSFDGDGVALKEMARTALADNRKVVGQVEDVLNSANFKTGKMSYDMKPFDFREALLESVSKYKPDAEAKGLVFSVSVAENQNYTVKGDRALIVGHLFKNLLENAINFTPSGSIAVDLSRADNAVRLSVADTGVGITPEDMKRLFTEGGHGKDSIKINVHSTGYGLFITKQIVDAHGGKIWAASAGAGKGATFFVELPVW